MFYHYTATGAKLVKHKGDNSTHYIGNIVYENNKLSYIITEEGRLVAFGEGADRTFVNEYTLKDHLGNSRITFTGASLVTGIDIAQTTSYYPFGLVMLQKNENTNSGYAKNKYLYNGKELQDEFFESQKLNWLDYGARFYDPQIGRWNSVDPLAEKYFEISPYNYCFNNPIIFLEPNGEEPVTGIIMGAAIGAFTEWASIVGSKMLFEDMTFSQANKSLTGSDIGDIAVSAGFGAASGVIDNGIGKFGSWVSNPRNQKILIKLLEVGIESVESSIKQIYKEEDFDLKSIIYGALTEVGMGGMLNNTSFKKAADKADKNAAAATKKADDLAKRKNPNQQKIDEKRKEATNYQRQASTYKKLSNAGGVTSETAKNTVGNKVQDETKSKKK